MSNDFIFHLLSTAHTSRGTNNLEMKGPNIFSIMFWSSNSHRMHHWWRGHLLTILCLATRITSQSLRPITHTMLTPPGISVYFEVNYARVTPCQKSSLQITDCVWVFFYVEVVVLESSARPKSCWLEKTSYLRIFWSDSSKYSGRHWRTPNVICCGQHEMQCPNKEHHRNWPFSTQPPLKL